MTDAHCHVSCGDPGVREFLIGRDFFGVHPWDGLGSFASTAELVSALREKLLANPMAGVGEIGLDRLKVRDIPQAMRDVFEAQLALALELNRPIVLHGAKCWGEVVKTVRSTLGRRPPPPLLFHGFSRSTGLIPDIIALNGYISVGPAVLNDHAVNYRELAKKIPMERLLVETDRTDSSVKDDVSVREVLAKLAEIRKEDANQLEQQIDRNARAFFGIICDL